MIEDKKSERPAFSGWPFTFIRVCFFCLLRERRTSRRPLFIRVDSILSPFGTLHRGMIHPLLIPLVSLVRGGLFFDRLVRRTRHTLGRIQSLCHGLPLWN